MEPSPLTIVAPWAFLVLLLGDVAPCRTAEVDTRVAAATEDYLRLRHRAKEAHAASAAEQRRCAEAREKVMRAPVP